jgi:predicted dithiol-disulfide oxidoreductase (DUF899 family)
MITFFNIHGAMVYVDQQGAVTGYEDVFTKIVMCRRHYEACGLGGGFGLSVFLRDGDAVYRSYFTTARGVDRLRLDFNLLDLTPFGRQESWEDSPAGWPQSEPYRWWRRHDEYGGA